MIVFKNYFKIAKKFLPVIIIYTVIFTFFAVASSSGGGENYFSTAKPNVAIINKDSDSKLSNTFVSYVKNNCNIKETNKTVEELRDELFYRQIDYIIVIPENFSKNLINKEDIKMETMKIPDSANSTYAEMMFNRFWNIASFYADNGMNEKEISNIILNDLEAKSEVTLLKSNQNEIQKVRYFYNFTNYTMLAISIFIVGMLINIFHEANINKRNKISPVNYKSFNRQLFLGNLTITLLVCVLYIIISMIMYGTSTMFTYNGLLIMLNFFIFSITALSLGFLVGNLVKNKEAQNGIVNVLALGSSFISGAFVPQEYLGAFVLGIAKFFPSYWYIKNNNEIANLSSFHFDSLQPIIINMSVILLFGIGFFIITNVITKLKLKKI